MRETKFKVGDRVRGLDGVQIPKGTIGIVTDVYVSKDGGYSLYGINGINARIGGNWGHHFELVTDIKVGDYVSIDGTAISGTVESMSATVISSIGLHYTRHLDKLTPAVKDVEPMMGSLVQFGDSLLVYRRQWNGWAILLGGKPQPTVRSWKKILNLLSNRNKGFTVL